jgi:hypothetical protein
MTARDRLDAARLRQDPPHVVARLEYAVACEEALHVADPPPAAPVWPWVLLALAAGVIAGATLIPNAEPIAQVVDAGGEE